VVADIPGLIEGAHLGHGLGHEFLRHIDRTRVLVHVVDVSQPDPEAAVVSVERELALHSPALLERPVVVAGNKMDLPDARARWDAFAAAMAARGREALPISAATGDGIPALLAAVQALLRRAAPVRAQEAARIAENTAPEPRTVG